MSRQINLSRHLRVSPHRLLVHILSKSIDRKMHLPELYDVLGEDGFYSFLEIFGGRTIEVPSVKDFQLHQDQINIWKWVKDRLGTGVNRSDLFVSASLDHGKDISFVEEAYFKVDKEYKDLERRICGYYAEKEKQKAIS